MVARDSYLFALIYVWLKTTTCEDVYLPTVPGLLLETRALRGAWELQTAFDTCHQNARRQFLKGTVCRFESQKHYINQQVGNAAVWHC